MREHKIGKVQNGRLITPTEREYKGIIVSNPTDVQLKILRGYVDIDTEQTASLVIPEYNEDVSYVVETYFVNEETGKINKRYDVMELPTHNEEEIEVEPEIEPEN